MKVLDLNKSNEWKTLLCRFEKKDIYYMLEYILPFYFYGDGEPILFYYEDSNIKAVNVAMKKPISGSIDNLMYFDLFTPYGYGGWIVEGHQRKSSIDNLFKEYSEHCINNNIVSEFVRFHPYVASNKVMSCFYQVRQAGKTVSIDLQKEDLWMNLDGKNRNVVRKAKKKGVQIHKGKSKDLLLKFKALYDDTMKRDGAKDYYFFPNSFYDNFKEYTMDNYEIFYAVVGSEIVSMAIILISDSYIHYHLSATNSDYFSYSPVNLLLYEVSCWAKKAGYKKFHLGGGVGSKTDGLFKFKKSFTKDDAINYRIGKKIFNKHVYKQLCDKNGVNEGVEFFPAYRS